jgi:uncharacterized protein YjgD (DUF1641 family)
MARPIPFDAPKRDVKAELLAKLELAPEKHAAALLDAYDLLQALHDRGMIDTARGFVGSANQVLEIAVEESLNKGSIDVMRNMMLMLNMLGSIAPETLKKFTDPIPQAVQLASVQSTTPGLWQLMKESVFNADFRRGLGAMIGILRAVGVGLSNRQQDTSSTSQK